MTVRTTIALSILTMLLIGSGCSQTRNPFRRGPTGTVVEPARDPSSAVPVVTIRTDDNEGGEPVSSMDESVRSSLHLGDDSVNTSIRPVLWQLDGDPVRPYESKPATTKSRPRGVVVEKPISDVTIDIEPTVVTDKGKGLPMPEVEDEIEVREFHSIGTSRPWGVTCYQWHAPAMSYQPLYFEEVNLERYGFSWGSHLQPFVSAGHFAGNTMLLPYHMLVDDPHCLTTPLGHDRPGSCVWWRHHRSPMPWEAVGCQIGMCSTLMCLP